jgi:glycosyltransferase involved in cell wall biosynthesis
MTATALSASLAVLHDMVEEGWPSMDQMGAIVTTRVPRFAPDLRVVPIHHRLQRLASIGPLSAVRPAFFTDRVLNRMVLYPRRARREVAGRFDIYHVVDHSYAQLLLELPAKRTVVTCHDVDTFRSLIDRDDPGHDPRSSWFRAMTRRILRGFRRAEIVVCVSAAARDDVLRFQLADASRLRMVPNGIDPALIAAPSEDARSRAAALFPSQPGVFDLLHVGSDIPRKRLDRVIDIVATLRQRGNLVRLVRVGSPFRPETRQRIRERDVNDIVELPYLDRDVLRAVYERCDLLLLPSDREGYGLPIVEAFAAGKPVIASDIPALRESAGGLATCITPDAGMDWVEAVERALAAGDPTGTLAAARRARAASQTWDEHARGLLPVYAELLDRIRASDA